MLRFALLSMGCFVLTVHAASLQDPVFTTANYTTYYVGQTSFLNSINNNGVAAGGHVGSGKIDTNQVVVYDPSYSHNVQGLYGVPLNVYGGGWYKVGATGINNNGTYVGFAQFGSSGVSGYIGSYTGPYTSTPLITLNVPGATATYPYAINNQGTIVGGYVSSTDGLEHGFIYRADGSFQTLDNPAFRNTTLLGINNQGQIVGTGGVNVNDNSQVGFLYSANAFTNLSYGQPVGINNLGDIAINTSSEGGGVLYPDGTLAIVIASINLFPNDPNDSATGPPLFAINDQGTLLFNSAYAFIATPVAAPVPEPSSLILLAIGVLGLTGLRARTQHCA